nr:hypothetical protein [Leptospira weilii]
MIRYQIGWLSIEELSDSRKHLNAEKEIHNRFSLCFPDIPKGKGHCAFFAMNIISKEGANRLGIPLERKRGYLVVSGAISTK